jgi:hypothetical protein
MTSTPSRNKVHFGNGLNAPYARREAMRQLMGGSERNDQVQQVAWSAKKHRHSCC